MELIGLEGRNFSIFQPCFLVPPRTLDGSKVGPEKLGALGEPSSGGPRRAFEWEP